MRAAWWLEAKTQTRPRRRHDAGAAGRPMPYISYVNNSRVALRYYSTYNLRYTLDKVYKFYYYAMTGARACRSVVSMTLGRKTRKTDLLCHLKDSTLTGEQDGGSQYTLNDLAADTLVKAFNTLLFQDRQQAIQCRLVFGGSGLESALNDTVKGYQLAVAVREPSEEED